MRRDFLFLVKGLPINKLVSDAHYFCRPMEEKTLEQLVPGLTKYQPGIGHFVSANPGRLFVISVRNEVPDEKDAIKEAWRTVSGIVDGYALLLDSAPPKVCPHILVRTGESNDAHLRSYTDSLWVSMRRQDEKPEDRKKLEETRDQLMQRLLVLFEFAAQIPRSNRPFVHQLLYSCRMFRHGGESGVFGIQFLCKFSALEGLVCGDEEGKKKKLLVDRLVPLFSSVAGMGAREIERLWELRCSASHQAKAFEFEEDPNTNIHAPHVVEVERFFVGSLVFALDHCHVQTIDDLWRDVHNYKLPEYATYRPHELHRVPATSMFLSPSALIQGIGASFDACYNP